MRIRQTMTLFVTITMLAGFGIRHGVAEYDVEQVVSMDELFLVRDGKALAPIVVLENAPPFTRRAANELADYIGRISGAKFEVIEGTPDPLPEHAIWVGFQPVLNELFPGIDFDFQYPEEILIAANAQHLVIAGRDRWDPEHLKAEVRRLTIDGVQQEYGTVNAVYTFLQDYLGVRWLWPGDSGIDLLPSANLAFEPFQYRYHPRFRGRADIFRFSALGDTRGHAFEWLRFQRLQLDSLSYEGGHPFAGWWERFHETNPEYFALQPDGTRGGGARPYPTARTVKLCKSNPAVWDQWLQDVEAALESNPNQLVFNAGANDSGASGFCICENCRAWDHPDGQLVRHTWQGLTQEYVAQSDRRITWANTLARMLKEKFPDRELYVGVGAYGNARPAPVAAVPDDNVIVGGVFNFHNRPPGDHRQLFLEWAAIAPNFAWRPNLGSAAGWKTGLPNVAPRHVINDLRLAADNNVIRIFFDTIWENWGNQGPHYYMLAQMAWNPYADGEAILADYYRRAFGPAADAMTAYWTLLEDAASGIVFDGRPQAEVWDAEFYKQAYAYLDCAAEAVADAPAVYGERLAFVRAGMDYMRLYFEQQELLARLKQSANDATREALRANWNQIDQIITAHPTVIYRGIASQLKNACLTAVGAD
ncbi:MAG: DUF4838 domain-containing protein [Kiritimatiellia bacterium]|nr:DUF4838 domain-containing protein [Lentisphaerota bacterium]